MGGVRLVVEMMRKRFRKALIFIDLHLDLQCRTVYFYRGFI